MSHSCVCRLDRMSIGAQLDIYESVCNSAARLSHHPSKITAQRTTAGSQHHTRPVAARLTQTLSVVYTQQTIRFKSRHCCLPVLQMQLTCLHILKAQMACNPSITSQHITSLEALGWHGLTAAAARRNVVHFVATRLHRTWQHRARTTHGCLTMPAAGLWPRQRC